ncbi:MAG TPA: hypothetical protein VKI65_17115, partial [Gemmataceae bacterium]|nr:hypothetical protein [Gemmataceae bacterium]
MLLVAGIIPIWRFWRANLHTSLQYVVLWATLAWIAWVAVLHGDVVDWTASFPMARYVALSLSACAGVAVLGARRPGAAAWNFVLLGLLSVLLLPLAQGFLTGSPAAIRGFWLIFLALTLGVGLLNYLFTRLGFGAATLAVAFALEIAALAERSETTVIAGDSLLSLAPWVGWAALCWRPPAATEFDRCWLDFRDRFGLIWAQRLREQFNRSAANAGWSVELRWSGLRITSPDRVNEAECLAT